MQPGRSRVLVLAAMLGLTASAPAREPVRYLAFQIFTGGLDSATLQQSVPPPSNDLRRTVLDLRDRIGGAGTSERRLGFVLGPISFDNSDEDVRRLIAAGFDIALETGVAVGFHVDDSMFWGRLKTLNAADSIEWLDWQRTLSTGRRLDWSSKPTRIMPQLCLNSAAVRAAVAARSVVLGQEIAHGIGRLKAARKDELFLGVIAGWETQLGRDFGTGKYLGYCALTNAGYGADRPPADIDAARSRIVMEFAALWARSLGAAGVPRDRVYSHIAYMSSAMYRLANAARPGAFSEPYLRAINFTPPAVAFCDGCVPGISTYPQPGHLEQWREELARHGNPAWASSEGTAIDPSEAERSGKGIDMEGYLGNLFNHGAILVNIFGWAVGDHENPFRKVAESRSALAAYRKFMSGAALNEARIPVPALPPEGLADKLRGLQARLPDWIRKNGPAAVKGDLERLDKALKDTNFDAAAEAANAILKTMEK